MATLQNNPLRIDLIVSQIFHHITTIQDILSCRQVCHQWLECSGPQIKIIFEKSPPLVKFQGPYKNKFTDEDTDSGDSSDSSENQKPPRELNTRVGKYLNTFRASNGNHPILSNFQLDDFLIKDTELKIFFCEFGNQIKHLKLSWEIVTLEMMERARNWPGSGYKHVGLKQLRSSIFQKCPNLESLVIRDVSGEEYLVGFREEGANYLQKLKKLEVSHGSAEFYQDIFASCPVLTNLFLGSMQETPFVTKILPALANSRCLSNLQELKVSQLNPRCFQLLTLEQLQLKKLSVTVAYVEREDSNMKRFLDLQKYSLESLDISKLKYEDDEEEDLEDSFPITFPDYLPKLTRLQLGELNPEDNYAPINFPVAFPSLKIFILDACNLEDDCSSVMGKIIEASEPHLTLQSIELPLMSIEKLRKVQSTFPNVTDLVIHCKKMSMLKDIWEFWPNLESLNFTNTTEHPGFVGIGQILTVFSAEAPVDRNEIPIDGSLMTNLQHWKAMTWESYPEEVGDRSISQVICKLPRLEFIKIGTHKVSKEVEAGFYKSTFIYKKKGFQQGLYPERDF